MSIDAAFKAGMDSVRAKGLDVRPKDVAAIAAYRVFSTRAANVQHDPRFPTDGPVYAATLILEAYASGK